MTKFGLCINTNGAVPDAAELAALHMRPGHYVRTINDGPLTMLERLCRDLPPGILIKLALNNQCWEVGFNWSGWQRACMMVADIARRYPGRIKIVGCGNELDLWQLQPPVGEPQDHLTPEFAANLVRQAAPILQPAGIQVAMTSVASGSWGPYMGEMAARCRGIPGILADLHLYAKINNDIPRGSDWQSCADALAEARRISGRPVIASEGGIQVGPAGGLAEQAWWVLGLAQLEAELICSWCWSDKMASPGEQGQAAYGHRGLDGSKKPSWDAIAAVFEGSSEPGVPDVPDVPPARPRDAFIVGSGIRDKMAARGDSPASHELYFHHGSDPQWSECVGQSGRHYRYTFSNDVVHTYAPEAEPEPDS